MGVGDAESPLQPASNNAVKAHRGTVAMRRAGCLGIGLLIQLSEVELIKLLNKRIMG
jgi:hypothetical protein